MDPVPVSSYWFLSYLFQSQYNLGFSSLPFPMNPHKLKIHIMIIKLREEKITRKP